MIYKSRIKNSFVQHLSLKVLSLVLFFALLFANLLFIPAAQSESPVSDRIRFNSLTIEDGLSQSTIYDITEDRLGFMWFGTQDGLNRYDGVKFDQLRHVSSDPKSLVSPTVSRLLHDQNDTIWVLTPQGVDGVNIHTLEVTHWTQNLKELTTDDELSGDSFQVHAISLTQDNNLLVLTKNFIALIEESDGAVTRLTQFDDVVQSYEASQFLANNNRIYLLDDSCVISVDMTGRDKSTECLSSDLNLLGLYPDLTNNSQFFITGEEGFAVFQMAVDGESASVHYHPVYDGRKQSPSRVRQLISFEGGYWLATESGLKYWDADTNTITKEFYSDYSDQHSINNDTSMSIWKSSDGLFWVGSLFGVNYWKSKQEFIHLLKKREVMNFKGNNYTTSLLKTYKGDLLVGTDSGIYRYNNDFSILQDYTPLKVGEHFVSTGYVGGLVEDRHRNLWIVSSKGLFLKPFDSEGFIHLDEVHDTNGNLLDLKTLSSIVESRGGDIWLGGENRFYQIKIDTSRDSEIKTSSLRFIDKSGFLPEQVITSKYGAYTIYEDLQGYLWVGSAQGLVRFNPINQSYEHYVSVQSDTQTLSNSDITVIYEDLLGVLWVGTVSGLNRVRYDSTGDVYFQRVTESDGFVDDFICSILADESGYLWISTANGLIKYHPDKGIPVNFTYEDGIQYNEFYTNADFADEDGNLYFGGLNGITRLSPNEITIDKKEKELQIISVKQGQDVISATKEGSTYFANVSDLGTVIIRLSTLDFINGNGSDYRYKVDALDDNWIDLDGPTIKLHNINQEQLLVRAQVRQKDGRWGDDEITLLLTVDKSFWASAQGFMLYLLILSLVVIGVAIYLSRHFSRRLTLQEKKLKERKAQTQLLLSEKKTLLYQVEDLQYSLSEQRYLSERLESQLESVTVNDQLTGFKSKHYLKQHINAELENIANTWLENDGIAGVYLGVFAVDIDNLAMINKEHGHLCGNEVLKQAAECLKTISYGTDTLVRWQGATLLILSRGIEKREQMIMAEKIRSIIASRKFDLGNGASIDVTCSVGFGRFPFLENPKEIITWEQLIYVINRAMTVAKNNSRNAWLGIYTNQFSHPQEIRAQITTNLSGLLASGQLDYVSSIPKSNKINWDGESVS